MLSTCFYYVVLKVALVLQDLLEYRLEYSNILCTRELIPVKGWEGECRYGERA